MLPGAGSRSAREAPSRQGAPHAPGAGDAAQEHGPAAGAGAKKRGENARTAGRSRHGRALRARKTLQAWGNLAGAWEPCGKEKPCRHGARRNGAPCTRAFRKPQRGFPASGIPGRSRLRRIAGPSGPAGATGPQRRQKASAVAPKFL